MAFLGWCRLFPRDRWQAFAKDAAYEGCWHKLKNAVATFRTEQTSLAVLPGGVPPEGPAKKRRKA